MRHRFSFAGIFLLLFLLVGCYPQNSPEVTKKMSLKISKATAGSLLVCNSGYVARISKISDSTVWVQHSPQCDSRELSIECAAKHVRRVVLKNERDYKKFFALFTAADGE